MHYLKYGLVFLAFLLLSLYYYPHTASITKFFVIETITIFFFIFAYILYLLFSKRQLFFCFFYFLMALLYVVIINDLSLLDEHIKIYVFAIALSGVFLAYIHKLFMK
jgi:hypothetical protein